ncbi:MAG TPA: MFS transporter [Mycobacteriales bacterium]|nr:MFS transporter [Mycobacteriales bacterium]
MLRDAPGWLRALLVGQFVNAACSLAFFFLTLYLIDDRGLSTGAAGLVTGAYGVGAIAGNVGGGSLGDRIGFRAALGLTQGLAALSCAAFPLSPVPVLGPLALVAGLTTGAARPVGSALVATGLPPGRRREGIALSRAAMNAGVVVGPPLGGLLAHHHFGWVFVLDGLGSALLMATVLTAVPRGGRATARPASGLLRALRDDPRIRLLALTVLSVDATYRLLYTVLPLLLADRDAPAALYGLTISLNGVVIVLLEPRIARRLAHRPAAPVVAAGYALVGLAWLLLGLHTTVVVAFVAVLVVTAGEMLYKPTATAHAADLAPAGMEGRYQSLYASASIGGMLLSPLLGTTLYSVAPRSVWFAAALTALAASAVMARGRS